jgi:hypothetical protein
MICACDTEYFYFEDIHRKQRQIYDDACDYGYVYNESEANRLKESLQALMNTYNYKYTKYGDIYKNGGFKVTMFISFERDYGMFNGVELTVSCQKDSVRKVKFVSVEIEGKASLDDGYKKVLV